MQLIIFIGGQASGKSTFFKQHFVDSHIRINLDMLRTRHREKLIFTTCLEAKQSCVIDNTNPTVADRQNYILQAKKARFEVIAYYFDSDLDQALARNELREGKAKIAQQGVLATYKKLQLPTWAEGYDQIYQVQLKQDTGFKVEALAKEDVAEEAVENELE